MKGIQYVMDDTGETTTVDTEGMNGPSVSIVAVTPVGPVGKIIDSWGSIKKGN